MHRSTRALSSSLVVLFAALGSSGCETIGHECTAAGCIDTLSVTLVGAGGERLPDGHYLVILQGGDEPESCEVDQPFNFVDGCRREAGNATFDELAPARVSVTVTRDGSPIASLTDVAPTYTKSFPNGPDCTPVCKHGELEVVIPSP